MNRKFQNECHTHSLFCYQFEQKYRLRACVRCTVTINFDVDLAVVQPYMLLFGGYLMCVCKAKKRKTQKSEIKLVAQVRQASKTSSGECLE